MKNVTKQARFGRKLAALFAVGTQTIWRAAILAAIVTSVAFPPVVYAATPT